jgi:hypothetical protein
MPLPKNESPHLDLQSLETGNHLISIYETEAEQMATLAPFLALGIARGAKTVFVTHDVDPALIFGRLSARSLPVERLVSRGQLVALRSDETYLKGGFFSVGRAMHDLVHLVEQTRREGWPFLCLAGEANWALCRLPGVEKLWRYEAEVHAYIAQSDCMALCQYNLDTFGKGFQRRVVDCHSHMAAGTQLFKVH